MMRHSFTILIKIFLDSSSFCWAIIGTAQKRILLKTQAFCQFPVKLSGIHQNHPRKIFSLCHEKKLILTSSSIFCFSNIKFFSLYFNLFHYWRNFFFFFFFCCMKFNNKVKWNKYKGKYSLIINLKSISNEWMNDGKLITNLFIIFFLHIIIIIIIRIVQAWKHFYRKEFSRCWLGLEIWYLWILSVFIISDFFFILCGLTENIFFFLTFRDSGKSSQSTASSKMLLIDDIDHITSKSPKIASPSWLILLSLPPKNFNHLSSDTKFFLSLP